MLVLFFVSTDFQSFGMSEIDFFEMMVGAMSDESDHRFELKMDRTTRILQLQNEFRKGHKRRKKLGSRLCSRLVYLIERFHLYNRKKRVEIQNEISSLVNSIVFHNVRNRLSVHYLKWLHHYQDILYVISFVPFHPS